MIKSKSMGLKNKLKIVAVTGLAALTFNCGDIGGGLAPKYKQQNKPIVTEITDHDRDGIPTDIEMIYGLNPYDADTDEDGLLDSTEGLSYFSKNLRNLSSSNQSTNDYLNGLGTNPLDSDTDDDGLIDGLEVGLERPEDNYSTRTLSSFDEDPSTTTNPLSFDTDGDGLWDGEEDNNYNGKNDINENNPNNIDSDNDGFTDEYGIAVHPLNPNDNTPPLAEYTATPLSGKTPLEVGFDSSGSFDPESGIAEYHWDFDNDIVIDSNEKNPIFIYRVPGNYTPKLIITNGSGLYASSPTLEVVVEDANTIALYHFDELSGNIAGDSSGNGLDGIVVGTTIIDGLYGKARSLNGSSDYIEVPFNPLMNIPNITVEADIYFNNFVIAPRIADRFYYPGGRAWSFYVAPNTGSNSFLRLVLSPDCNNAGLEVEVDPSFPLTANAWHHVAFTYNGLEAKILQDGVVVFSQAYTGGMCTIGNSPITMGTYFNHTESFLDGSLDELRISNVVKY